MNISLSCAAHSQRLKSATHAVHDALDKRIMSAEIFSSRENFAGFLRVQNRFHQDIAPLYASPELVGPIPELARRRRLAEIARDLSGLGQSLPLAAAGGGPGRDTPLPEALGWLYVAEGSNLGGVVLFRLACEKPGLGQDFGARHLAAHPDGADSHWRHFTAALDAVDLSPPQVEEMVRAAEDAFRAVHGYVEQELSAA